MALFSKNKKYVRQPLKNFPTSTPSQTDSGLKQILKKICFFLLFLSFLGVSVYIFFFSPFLTLKIILRSHSSLNNQITYGINQEINRKILWVFPKNNFFILPEKELQQKISQTYREIKNLRIEKKFPDKLLVDFEARKPFLVWCLNDKCFWMDDEGVPYKAIPSTDLADYSDYITIEERSSQTPDSIKNNPINNEGTDYQSVARFIVDFRNEIEKDQGNFPFAKNVIFNPAFPQEITLSSPEGWKIYLNTLTNPRNVALNLLTLLKKMEPQEKEKLEYIDLRIKHKIFYKTRPDSDEETAEASEDKKASDDNDDNKDEKKDEKADRKKD